MVKTDENKPVEIKEMLERVYGIKISYWKAWKAKEIAMQLVRGKPEESFMGLPCYLWLLNQANPGTISAYQVDMENCFEQCFLALGPSVAGFRSCMRPVIAIDACFLKGRYRGKLFHDTCMGGNNQIYQLAFGVAATENDESWTWFFKKLLFISNRHPSIEKCCKQEFLDATYGICMFHLCLNMASRYKVKEKDLLYGVAKAYTKIDFEEKLNHIRHTRKEIYEYLMNADPSKWALCLFPSWRYSVMTTNIVESMNVVLREAREFPIIGMLEIIRMKLQGWFHDRLRMANKWTNTLTPYAERKLGKRDDKSHHFNLHLIDAFRFYVLDGRRDATVDINLRTCPCNVFQLNQLHCPHAIKACRERDMTIYNICSRFYNIECLTLAYSIPVNPVPHRSEWYRLVPESVQSVLMGPPVIRNKKGRRKNKGVSSQGEEIIRKHCSRCRQLGHNKQICTKNEYVPVHQHEKIA
ncbi:hypothetical protein LIER_41077 [Lithospermum erythrorhizon]|uniref:SWIM-type domain-containing protein n=1 Tax=Lithospermum erythrorhizon TaxID=34254 RepID=A0AAV3R537_LITER